MINPSIPILGNLKWTYQFGYVQDGKRFCYDLNQETGWWRRRRVSENEPEICHYCPAFWADEPVWKTAEEWNTK